MSIFDGKLSLRDLSKALLKRPSQTRYFVEIDSIVEVGAKVSLVDVNGDSLLIPNEKIIRVEE